MRHPRQVLTRATIFDRVWGYDFGPASNSLEVYVGYLRRKTEAAGEPRLVHTVRGVGYVLRSSRAMSFRRRMVLLAAGAVAAAVVLASVVVYVVTRDELRGQIDASLRQKLTPGLPQSVQIRPTSVSPTRSSRKLQREGKLATRSVDADRHRLLQRCAAIAVEALLRAAPERHRPATPRTQETVSIQATGVRARSASSRQVRVGASGCAGVGPDGLAKLVLPTAEAGRRRPAMCS